MKRHYINNGEGNVSVKRPQEVRITPGGFVGAYIQASSTRALRALAFARSLIHRSRGLKRPRLPLNPRNRMGPRYLYLSVDHSAPDSIFIARVTDTRCREILTQDREYKCCHNWIETNLNLVRDYRVARENNKFLRRVFPLLAWIRNIITGNTGLRATI